MSTSLTISTSRAYLTCLCSCVRLSGTVLASPTLPITDVTLCHCNVCREVSGALAVAYPRLKCRPPEEALKKCGSYAGPKGLARWWFCGSCGSNLFVEEIGEAVKEGEGRWWCFGGVVEQAVDAAGGEGEGGERGLVRLEDTVKIGNHHWVGDTVDGGLVARLRAVGGTDIECSVEGDGGRSRVMSKVEIEEMVAKAEREDVPPSAETEMVVKCHCGGVDIRVKRANFSEDKQGLSALFTEAGDRYIAQFCACRSCRLQSGVSLQPWTYIPLQNFRWASTGKQVVFGREAMKERLKGEPTLKHYWSSEGVCRSFCGKCGASVFYWNNERPQVVDLSMGIVRGKGAMAREWVNWRWRVSWEDECVDEELRRAIVGSSIDGASQ